MISSVEKTLREELVEFRRILHQQPELSLEEYETTKKIAAFLDRHGIERLSYPLATGVLAIVRGNQPGPCVAVRADIDALPIVEETNLPFKSETSGKMHACGHDFHTSGVLGAAVLAKQLADSPASFAGQILFVFQPAEEIGNGAQFIVQSGVFDDFKVRSIIGEHNNPLQPTGTIGVKAGPIMASVDEFRVVVKGVGGHAAIPELTVDPILVAANMVAGLQHIVSRNMKPLHAVVVTVGQLHAGTARNIIPMEAVFEGTVRCLQPELRDAVEARFRAFVASTAEAYQASAEVTYERVLPGVDNDAAITEIVREAAIEVVGPNRVLDAVPSLGGEDFALYQQHLPGCFFWVGTGKPDGTSKGWHHPGFDVDESMISVTSEVFLSAALKLLNNL